MTTVVALLITIIPHPADNAEKVHIYRNIFQNIDPIRNFSSEYKQIRYLQSTDAIILQEGRIIEKFG